MNLYVLLGLFTLISILVLVTVLAFKYLWTKKSKIRSYLINISVLIFTLLYLFLIAEIFIFTFIVHSEGLAISLTARRWLDKYWKPINSLGYRDVEHPESQFLGKKVLFVVGDSLVAGHGIKDYRDRFSNVLQDLLGDNWLVINISQRGWQTEDEYRAIVSYPYIEKYKPDVIVVSYFINDIEGAAQKMGFDRPVLVTPPSKLIRPIVENSHFFNLVYWLLRFRSVDIVKREIADVYWEYIRKCYSNKKIWRAHKRELLEIVNYSKNRKIDLIFVVFPNLVDIERTKFLTAKVVDLMETNNVEVLDLATKLSGRNPWDLIVNMYDAHPNVKLHREVAELLYMKLNSEEDTN